jgi:uncharacterized protein (DUF2252 family)
MAASPLAFFQGATAVMAADLRSHASSGLEVQVCGDAHLLNLEARAGCTGSVVAGLAELDETCRGPFEWDLMRLAASLAVTARELGHDEATCGDAVRAMARAYRDEVERCSQRPAHELSALECAVPAPLLPLFEARELAAPRARATRTASALASALLAGLESYPVTLAPEWRSFAEEYTARDAAPQTVSLTSLATAALGWRVVLSGPGATTLALEVKEQRGSCWQDGSNEPAVIPPVHEGRRVVEAEQRLHASPDPLLGWTRVAGKDVTVRGARPPRRDLDPRALSPRAIFEGWARLCGAVLAMAHARTGDAAAIAGYAGSSERLDVALAGFAAAYADQTELDFERFRRAFADRVRRAG